MTLAELAHVEAHDRLVVIEERLRERLRQLGLADAGRAEEQERPDGSTLVAHAGAVASHRAGNGGDGVILSDDALVQLALERAEALALRLGQATHGDAGRTTDDRSDLRLVDHRRHVVALTGRPLDLSLHLGEAVAQHRRLLVLLGGHGGVLLRLECGSLGHEVGDVDLRAEAEAQARTRLIDEVDGLVGQHAIAEIAVAELHRGAQRIGRVGDSVVLLVRGRESLEDADRVFGRRLTHPHGLESPFQRRVLLDRAVLLERGRSDQVQVAAREAGLQDVPRIHAAVAAASGADDRVHFVDEDDDLVAVRGDLIHRLREALLEVSAVAGAGEHRGQIEDDHPLVRQLRRNAAGGHRQGESLDDRRLADAGFSDEHGVVLRATTEDLDRLLDLVGTADDRVERAFACPRGEVRAETVEHRRRRRSHSVFRRLGVARHGLTNFLGQRLRGHAGAREDLPRGSVLREHEGEEQVLGVDIGRSGRARHLVGVEERSLHRRGDHRAIDMRSVRGRRQPVLRGADDRRRVGADALDRVFRRRTVDEHTQNVQRVEFLLAPFERVSTCGLQDLLRRRTEESTEVDRSLGAGALAREIACEELVEGAVAFVGGEVFGHSRSLHQR